MHSRKLFQKTLLNFLGGGGAVGGRLKNFNIIDVHRKFWFLEALSWKTNIWWGGGGGGGKGVLPKKEAWTVSRLKGGLGKKYGMRIF